MWDLSIWTLSHLTFWNLRQRFTLGDHLLTSTQFDIQLCLGLHGLKVRALNAKVGTWIPHIDSTTATKLVVVVVYLSSYQISRARSVVILIMASGGSSDAKGGINPITTSFRTNLIGWASDPSQSLKTAHVPKTMLKIPDDLCRKLMFLRHDDVRFVFYICWVFICD